MTTYLRAVRVHDGYAGHMQTLHLCREPGGRIFGVYHSGYIVWADPARGIGPMTSALVTSPRRSRSIDADYWRHDA